MRFGVLGSVEAWRDGTALPPGPPRRRALLGILLVEAGRVVPVDRLVRALWDNAPPASARNAVHGLIAALRKLLAGEPGVELVTRPTGYQLVVDPQAVDLHRFRALVAEAGRAGQTDEQAAALLHDALTLWRGAPLADLRFDWVRQDLAPLLERELLDALEQRLELDLRLGAHHELVGELTSLTKDHPTRPRFWYQLMLALYRAGRQAEALETYRAAHVLFRAGLDAELRALHHSILSGTPAQPEQVIDTPRPAGVCQLPPGANGFVGRAELLSRLDTLLVPGPRPVVAALAGPPGVGKTTVAVQWAHGARGRFPDGQLYVNLRGYATSPPMPPTEALARLLRALGVRPDHVPAALAEQIALYRKALSGKRVLVVLDNTAGAGEVRPLLPDTPGSAALITSRDSLRALEAPTLTVDVLPAADAVALLGDVLGADLVHKEPGAALELAALCARLPLALRIAGANFAGRPHRDLTRYVTDLRAGNRLDALSVDGDSEAAVHAAFDLSYAMLDPLAQRLFRLLGLLPGPDFGLPLAAAVADLTEAETSTLLERLIAANLVQEPGSGRFQCHDLLREYACARAEDTESPAQLHAALRRAYEFLTRTAASAEPSIVDGERPSLVAAASTAAERGLPDYAWRIADALHGYFGARGGGAEAVATAEAGLAAAMAVHDRPAQARMHALLGQFQTRLGSLREAAVHQQRAVELYRSLGDPLGQAVALDGLGMAYGRLGQPQTAAEHHAKSLALYREAENRTGESSALNNLGAVHQQLGRFAEAIEFHRQAVALGNADGRLYLGVGLFSVGRTAVARTELELALAGYQESGNRVGEAAVLSCVAAVHRDRDELAECEQVAAAAVALARELGDRRIEANGLNILAAMHRRRGTLAVATGYFQLAIRIAEEMGFRAGRVHAVTNLAGIAREEGRHTEALAQAEDALTEVRAGGLVFMEPPVLTELAHIKLGLGEPTAAAGLATAAVELARQTGQLLFLGTALAVRGLVLTEQGGTVAAAECWQEAIGVLRECEASAEVRWVTELLAG
ncbi:AfsR/SARP family transcriptional regulator [Crossiella cryophila]|uniref:DNA-binding SARP family transcriptional activator/DNA polymerase III delta prime subunit n=1 Tax=Crossiella cryophila TaxID=43355 RepID=A0A7W7CJA7_9PSEU|nr:BTAD domain-containing putative transcriptional regulator [Crossiella cryophila]MBB4682258.1 DNA-binding SARP family transcriptional activator/DNA polymerase III delta prime subunit [Crossiella cryophila]